MDPSNIKNMFFRGKAFIELQEYEKAVEVLTMLCHIDPTHVDGRNELVRAKHIKKAFLEDQHKKYSKFFS
jgi:cytochrome c-type biogenesis protein CcmH/NrfG